MPLAMQPHAAHSVKDFVYAFLLLGKVTTPGGLQGLKRRPSMRCSWVPVTSPTGRGSRRGSLLVGQQRRSSSTSSGGMPIAIEAWLTPGERLVGRDEAELQLQGIGIHVPPCRHAQASGTAGRCAACFLVWV